MRHRAAGGPHRGLPPAGADLYPATKAEQGEHDENVSFDAVVAKLGKERAEELRAATLRIYSEAARIGGKGHHPG